MTESPKDPSQDPLRHEPADEPAEAPAQEGPADAAGPSGAGGSADADAPAGPPADPAAAPADEPVDAGAQPAGDRPAGDQSAGDELAVTRMELEERTLDLQRLQAEFVNYKRRVDRDRELIRENATFQALAPITDVLDNIDRAREHGPLEEGFRAVAEQLERVVAGQGLVRFGVPGDAFDPNIHDALSHMGEDPDVEVTTVKVVAKGGYRIGERVVRAAQVLVVDPAVGTPTPDAPGEEPGGPSGDTGE